MRAEGSRLPARAEPTLVDPFSCTETDGTLRERGKRFSVCGLQPSPDLRGALAFPHLKPLEALEAARRGADS